MAASRSRFSVRVPVLSVTTVVTAPRVSPARSRRSSAPCRASRRPPSASSSVIRIGSSSGTVANATVSPAGGVGEQEPTPPHLAGASQERRIGPQHRHEPAEEHHLHPVPVEQVAGGLQLPFIQPHPAPVAAGQPGPPPVPHPVAHVVPPDPRRRPSPEEQPRIHPAPGPPLGARRDQ